MKNILEKLKAFFLKLFRNKEKDEASQPYSSVIVDYKPLLKKS